MQANTAVRIVDLQGRSDLNGAEGLAERMDAATGRYVVHVGRERVKLKASNLVVKDHREAQGPPPAEEVLICNGLHFCFAHRLECCGACVVAKASI